MRTVNDPVDIRNWVRRPNGITTSGKLEADDPARLAAIGVRHVVNLALDDHPEALKNERELLAQHGIKYTHIPVPFDKPTREHVDQMIKAIEGAPGPTHVHCIMNYRVSAFFYILDCESGVPEAQARELMTKVWDPLFSDDPRVAPWRKLLS
ncbi:hypothetical protein AUC45_07625 [Erythrobacter sp. YT30]|nr:hypothetical protein AUC45_07625 [Erythrobacter sp. YT30]